MPVEWRNLEQERRSRRKHGLTPQRPCSAAQHRLLRPQLVLGQRPRAPPCLTRTASLLLSLLGPELLRRSR